MTTLKLIQNVVMLTVIFAALVIAFWIFPRLFLALCSPAIWQSIRRHPILHLLWAVAGLTAIYVFFQMMGPAIAY